MGKDKTGKYHPPKGKPSGINKSEGLGAGNTDPDKMDEYNRVSDEYTTEDEKLAEGVRELHPNRNESKGEVARKETPRTES